MKNVKYLLKKANLLNKFVLCLLIICCHNASFAKWFSLNQAYQTEFTRVKMVNSTLGFAIGYEGSIVRTTDGGTTWSGLASESSASSSGAIYFYDLSFVSATTGYVVGSESTVIKTLDGGNTWFKLPISNNNATINSVHFISADTGYVGDANGKIFKTINGGGTWSQLTTGITSNISRVFFTNASTGWFIGAGGTVKKTIDGGATWTAQVSGTTADLYSISFISPTTGWIASYTSVFQTMDGGSTWTLVNSSQSFITDMQFLDANNGWFVNSNAIKSTTDGGSTWATKYGYSGYYPRSVYFSSATTGFAVGSDSRIMRTLDGGANWTLVNSSLITTHLYAAGFAPSSSNGWIVGANGTLMKSTDYGNTWALQGSGSVDNLVSVYAASNTVAWFTGASGLIRKTTDGGVNWTTQTTGLSVLLYDIKFINANEGLCVGDAGVILKTVDGGTTWTQVVSGTTTNALRNIYYVSSSVVYVVGHGGYILKSINGGSTWTTLTSGVTSNLIGVYFTSATEGYVCGINGTILKTIDSGNSWTAQTTNTTKYFVKMLFTSATNGWAVGQDGNIFRTQNGGTTWAPDKTFTYRHVNSITLLGNGDLLATIQTGGMGKFTETCPANAPTSYSGFDSIICPGQSVTLNVKGEGQIGWYSAPVGGTYLGSGEVFTTPALSANTTFYAQDSTCSASATRTAVMVPVTVPPVVANATSDSICTGSAVTLTGGGALSYSWSGAVVDGVSFVPSATDTYTVTGTDTNSCSANATITVTVNPQPVVGITASDDTVCSGASILLSGTGAASYSWTGGVNNGFGYQPAATDTYTVTGTDANNCSDTSSITITVLPLPAITASASEDSICPGSSVTLTGNGGLSYGWSGGVTDNVAFVPSATTTYTVLGTDVNNCSNQAAITVTIKQLPNTAITISGDMLTVAEAGGTYLWLNCDNGYSVVSGAVTQTLLTVNDDEFAVVVTKNGCVDTSLCIGVNSVGINETTAPAQLHIYPNPGNGTVTIHALEKGAYTLVNELGQTLQSFELNSMNNYRFTVENLSKGIYFVAGYNHNRMSREKLVVIE